jgi:hypothetical protein
MKLTPEVNCWQCPKLCCYSLARDGMGFSHPSNRPTMCRHCDIVSEKWCKIHDTLHPTSRSCDSYTCYGIGNQIVDIFWLLPDIKASLPIQYTFRQRQWIARYLWFIKEFLKEYKQIKKLHNVQKFVKEWELVIFTCQETHRIHISEFVTALNALMRKEGIGYDTKNCQFCFL